MAEEELLLELPELPELLELLLPATLPLESLSPTLTFFSITVPSIGEVMV